jgi:dolichol-phosphate mannosyltransferase
VTKSANSSLTVVVAAYNEATTLAKTVEEIVAAAERTLASYEVIIVDDGSTDGTAEVADGLAQRFPRVVVVHHGVNKGLGAAFLTGVERARQKYLTLIPGDNAYRASGIARVFEAVGSADVIVSYRSNFEARALLRRTMSRTCTLLMRIVTGCPIRDSTSMFVVEVERLRQIEVSAGYSFHLEVMGQILSPSDRYLEIPVELNSGPDASSGVMKPQVLWGQGTAMLRMFYLRRIGAPLLRRRSL